MSTHPAPLDDGAPQARPLRVRSVVGLAHDEIRSMIVSGALPPGSRLGQGELADQLGISRGSVREALRRLAGDRLVEFEVNRGFFVADMGLDNVRRRLEVRLTLEPEIARLAAARRTEPDLVAMRATIELEAAARSSDEAHDQSRAFHLAVAGATGNDTFARVLESLWIADVGRRLLAERRRMPTWQHDDVDEHRAIVAAIEARKGRKAALLMRSHVESAVRHWSPRSAQE